MTEYTPTTAMIEDAYVQVYGNHAPSVHEMSLAEFDRWLAAHDREVAAKVRAEVIDWIDRTISNDLRGPAVAIIARQHFELPQKGAE